MRDRIRALRNRLLQQYARYDESLRRDSIPRSAAYSFLLRAHSLDHAIWLLLDSNSVPEAAILLRSQLNLLWCFLFMVDARSHDGHFEFDDNPPPSSNSYRRAARYLSWHCVELNRRNRSPQSQEMFARFIREHGYRSEREVPKYWYQEGGIQTIKHLADSVGGLRQYNDDYTHLSGIEHTDITASIVQELCGERYGDFIALKSSHVVAALMDFATKICGCTVTIQAAGIVEDFNRLFNEVTRTS